MKRSAPPPRTLDRFASSVDAQIAEAQARGEFDHLPGAGKPLPPRDISDPAWWAKQKLQAEGLQPVLPPALELRRDVERAFDGLRDMSDECRVLELFEKLNARIRRLNATHVSGPSTGLVAFRLDRVLASWRAARQEAAGPF